MNPEDRWPIRGGERRILDDGGVGLEGLDAEARRAVAESIAAAAEPGLRAMLASQRQSDMLSGATISARERTIPTRTGVVDARTQFNNGQENLILRPRANLKGLGQGPIGGMRIMHILGQTQYDPRLTEEEKASGLKFLWAAADRTFYDNIVDIFHSEGLYFRKDIPTPFVRSNAKRTATIRGSMEAQLQVQGGTLFVYIVLHISSTVRDDKKDEPYEVCYEAAYFKSTLIFTTYASAYFGDTSVFGQTLEVKYPDGEYYFISSESQPREYVIWTSDVDGRTKTAWGSTFSATNRLQPSGRAVVPTSYYLLDTEFPVFEFEKRFTKLARSETNLGVLDPNTLIWLQLWGTPEELAQYEARVARPAITFAKRTCYWVYPGGRPREDAG